MLPDLQIIKPQGILDNNKSLPLRQQAQELTDSGHNVIVIDFTEVTFMDSSGLGSLIIIRRMVAEQEGRRLFLMSLNEQVKMLLFELTNTGQFFEVVDNKAELEEKLLS